MARKYDDGSEILRASDVEPEMVQWLWRQHIAQGMLTVVAGRPGSRKSLFAAHVTADVTNAGKSVIFSNVEDPAAQVTRPRLEAAGADLDKVLFWRPFLPAMLEQTERVIREHNVGLIVLDPIVKHMTVSIWNDAEFGEAMVPVFDMLSRTGCAILGVHHTKKNVNRNSDPQEAIGGSAGSLLGSCRAAFIMGPNPHDATERVVAPVKFNIAAEPFSLALELDVVEFFDVDELLDRDTWMILVRMRGKGRCENCGQKVGDVYRQFHAHHKDGDGANNRLRNGELLCPTCHSRAHMALEGRSWGLTFAKVPSRI